MSVTHGVESGQYQAMTLVPMAHGVYPVQYHAMAQEAQPAQYQLTHGMQSGQYQAVTQVPVANGTYPVQYHAMAQGAQPMLHQVMTQVPVSHGGQLHYMLVGGQGQYSNPVNQPQLPYMFPLGQSGYVTSTPMVPASQVDMSGATPHLVSQNVVNAMRGVNDNVAEPYGQRALPPGQLKSRLQSLPKALVYDGRGSWQTFLTKFEKFSTNFEWKDREKRDYLCFCLTDKASEYYAFVMDIEVELSYLEVVEKLERRFGYRDLPEAARVTLSSARQGDDELVDDWADPCKRRIYGIYVARIYIKILHGC
ncbi:hypothetical protein DPMN_039665 [Dreissena polymorpha]|uniref:Uncharacterized protein n=1 Tax=Dreissena polymorpha TaxID=45954 RepID=A0A9D4HSE2_DREPO|nr:hypothetical protein DPMN_039665 [Dreissena polymorpha]